MRRFYIFLYGVTALAQLPFVAGVACVAGSPWGWAAGAAVAVALVVLFYGRVKIAQWDRHISAWQRHLLEEPYFVHWCASLLSLTVAVVAVPIALLAGREVTEACLFCYLFALPFAVWGVVIRRRWVRVRNIDVELASLPRAFEGYRIAQLSDLHVGSHCPRSRVEAWVRRVNGLDVDLVALTGDYVTSGVRYHEDIAAALGGLAARDGVYAVMGNHDYYGDGEPLMTLLAERGIRLLRNEATQLARGDAIVHLAGVDDIYTKRIDIDAATRGLLPGAPLVMLAHDPASFPELARRGCSLVLSGHTHWGQIGVPWLADSLNYARLMTRHAAGRYELDGATLYVSPGLGTTGPPVRLGTWPEITLVTLRAAGPDIRPAIGIDRD